MYHVSELCVTLRLQIIRRKGRLLEVTNKEIVFGSAFYHELITETLLCLPTRKDAKINPSDYRSGLGPAQNIRNFFMELKK